MDCQDWTHVTVRRARTSAGLPQTNAVKYSAAASHMRKIEQSDEIIKPKELSSTSRTGITQKRVELGLNQVQLNQQCAFPANTIRDIESGRVAPSPGQLNTLNRVLKISLKYDRN